jgi:PAS domain S-box-containing protein
MKSVKKMIECVDGIAEFLEAFPEAVIIHDGETVEHVNRAGLRMFGAESAAGMAGLHLARFFCPNCRQTVSGQATDVKESGAPLRPVEQRLLRLDGSAFHGEVTGGSFIYKGKSALFSVISDVERRERAEEELHNCEIRYRELVESANSIILRFDASFNITFMNKYGRELFGCEKMDLTGKRLMDVIPPTQESSGRYVKSIIEDIFRNPQKYKTHETEVKRRDGSRLWISWTNKPVYDESGKFREVLSIGNDITERKVAEVALHASREQMKSMGAELSIAEERERQRIATEFHDLVGQNLAMAKIKLDTLLGSPSSCLPAPIREVRELLGEAIRELRSQIFRISPPILHMVGFEAAVESLCDMYKEDCGISVVFMDDGKIKVIAEELRGTLYTMVRELLLNVAKHADAKNVVVSLEKVEENIEIRVEDDGAGFDQSQVCQPSGKKSCLGLFSIKQRIEYLGGSMETDSEPGRGTRIALLVPLKSGRHWA